MKETAGLEPAATGTIVAGQDELVSLAEAMRRTGVPQDSLRGAIDVGKIPASREQRPYEPGRFGTRTQLVMRLRDVEEWLASLDSCRYPGCGLPGWSRSGCCSGPHAIGVQTRGVPRSPEARAKMSATLRGRPRGKHAYSQCVAIRDGLSRFWSSAAGDSERASRAERMAGFWRSGEGAPPVVLKLKASGTVRSRYFGRWSGRLGGKPRGYTDEQAAAVLAIRAEQSAWGIRTIHRRAIELQIDVSLKQVRAILGG